MEAAGVASVVRSWLRARAVRVGRPGLRVGTTALRTMGLGAVTVTAGISLDVMLGPAAVGQRRCGGGAEQEQACSGEALRAPQFK